MAGYGLIADDLTGALDAGAPFVRAGLRAVLPFSGEPPDVPEADVVLLNTESREAPLAKAREAALRAAGRLRAAGVERAYKKIDSVLRGHPGPELEAVLQVFGGRALVAPAFPAQGRTTQDGRQHLHGRPVERQGGRLVAVLEGAAGRSDVYDARTEDDLAAVARLGAGNPAWRVWCGTAGLAPYVPGALELRPAGGPPPQRPPVTGVLVIAGSLHPATAAQLAALAGAGWPQVTLEPGAGHDVSPNDASPHDDRNGPGARLRAALLAQDRAVLRWRETVPDGARLEALRRRAGGSAGLLRPLAAVAAAAVAAVLGGRPAGTASGLGLVMTGGETALAVCQALGGRSVEVTGEAQAGVPLGLLRRPGRPGGDLPIATKSGGFGQPEALLDAAQALRA